MDGGSKGGVMTPALLQHRFTFRAPGPPGTRQQHPNQPRFPQSNMNTRFSLKDQNTNPAAMNIAHGMTFDGKRMRKSVQRKTIDYYTTVLKYLQNRVWQRERKDRRAIQPDSIYHYELVPPASLLEQPMNCVTTKFMRQATNKFKCPIFSLAWTPEGRRLVTGASSGEFTLWNGLAFNFETILQAHDCAVRAMKWSNNDTWMLTADHNGFIKYWQSNMNNVKMFQAHRDPIRDLSFSPSDTKFTTCSDDGTVRIWDFLHCHEERVLRGHGADVKCVSWHPQKSLIVSGSKDAQQPLKLWDPRTGDALSTIHVHKNTIMDLEWNKNGNWLLTASRDHSCKIFDIRNMKEEYQTFKGHKKEVSCVSWNPVHENLFASGGSDGALLFWIVGSDKEVGAMDQGHDGLIWTMEWHPMGHVLATGSNDHCTKFWSRNRPGDNMKDKYNLNLLPVGVSEELSMNESSTMGDSSESFAVIPGMGLEHGMPDPGSFSGMPYSTMSPGHRRIQTKRIPQQFQKAWEGGAQPMVPAPNVNSQMLAKKALLGTPRNINGQMNNDAVSSGGSKTPLLPMPGLLMEPPPPPPPPSGPGSGPGPGPSPATQRKGLLATPESSRPVPPSPLGFPLLSKEANLTNSSSQNDTNTSANNSSGSIMSLNMTGSSNMAGLGMGNMGSIGESGLMMGGNMGMPATIPGQGMIGQGQNMGMMNMMNQGMVAPMSMMNPPMGPPPLMGTMGQRGSRQSGGMKRNWEGDAQGSNDTPGGRNDTQGGRNDTPGGRNDTQGGRSQGKSRSGKANYRGGSRGRS